MVWQCTHRLEARMADLDTTCSNDQTQTGIGKMAQRHAARSYKSSGSACALSDEGRPRYALPLTRNTGMVVNRQGGFFWLYSSYEPGHHRPSCTGETGCKGNRQTDVTNSKLNIKKPRLLSGVFYWFIVL